MLADATESTLRMCQTQLIALCSGEIIDNTMSSSVSVYIRSRGRATGPSWIVFADSYIGHKKATNENPIASSN